MNNTTFFTPKIASIPLTEEQLTRCLQQIKDDDIRERFQSAGENLFGW